MPTKRDTWGDAHIAGPSRYAEKLKAAMQSRDNPTGHVVTIRQLSEAVGRTYELCRLVLKGQPVGSREFNDAACRYLGLPADAMWKLAQIEKARRRFGTTERELRLPPDARLIRAWELMSETDREQLVRVAERLAFVRRKNRKGDVIIIA